MLIPRRPDYRAYLIGEDGHFHSSIELVCADDDEAKEKADGHDVELWQRDRKVETFKSPKIKF